MKVWYIEGHGMYSGGLAIVAAPTIEEAQSIANANASPVWNIDYNCDKHMRVECGELPVKYKGETKLLRMYEMGE